jgi:hypothetical protein
LPSTISVPRIVRPAAGNRDDAVDGGCVVDARCDRRNRPGRHIFPVRRIAPRANRPADPGIGVSGRGDHIDLAPGDLEYVSAVVTEHSKRLGVACSGQGERVAAIGRRRERVVHEVDSVGCIEAFDRGADLRCACSEKIHSRFIGGRDIDRVGCAVQDNGATADVPQNQKVGIAVQLVGDIRSGRICSKKTERAACQHLD